MAVVIVLDASVLIGYLDAEDEHHERAVTLLAGSAEEQFLVNVLTLAETLVGPVRAGREHVVHEVLEALDIRQTELPADAASPLARLRVTSRLPMPDCCVLLTAVHEAASIATFDRRLSAAARKAGVPTLP